MGLRPFQLRGAYLCMAFSSKIPTLIIGVSISITSMDININITIASSYLPVASVGG